MKVKLVWYVAKIVQCAMMGTTEHNVDIYFKTAIRIYCDLKRNGILLRIVNFF